MTVVLILGPGTGPGETSPLPDDVRADVERLTRPGVEVGYRFVGGGPDAIRSDADAAAAAPFVVAAAIAADGCDAIVVDCTDDPGVEEARHKVTFPVIGAGEALRSAMADEAAAGRTVRLLTGDELRDRDLTTLLDGLAPGCTVALGGTGWSHLVERIEAAGHHALDPLPLAVAQCVAEHDARG